MSIAYYDGQFVAKDSLRLSPLDYGFSRGVTVFESTRVYGGIPFRLDDHLARFVHAAATFDIPLPMPLAEIADVVGQICAKNRYAHSGMKFYLTLGECARAGDFGFKNSANFTPHFIALEDELFPKHPDAPKGLDICRRGIALKTVPFARHTPDVKTINYAPGYLAARGLIGTDFDEILFVRPDGRITETTTSNFFCVIDGVLCTAGRDMLWGVTRKVLLELARIAGISVAERDITPQELGHASEAFITGTYLEMVPVRQIDDVKYAATMDAPVYAKLRAAFTKYIADYRRSRSPLS